MKKLYPTLLAVPAMALAAPSVHATVLLQDMYEAGAAGGAPTDLGGGVFGYEITLNPATDFSAAGHDKLVLAYSGWDNATANSTVTSVTYDGVSLTEAVFSNDNGLRVTAGIYYLDNVTTDGTLRIELVEGGQLHFGYGLYALDGLKAGVQDTASGRVDPATENVVTMTTDSGFFVQQATRNNQSLAGDAEDDYETLFNYNVDSFRALSQYQVTSAAGDYVAPIGNTGVNFRTISSAAFEAADGPPAIPGDTDGDGDIDDSDLGTSFSNYTGPVGAAGGKTAAEGDTDGDGDVDDSDLGTSFSGYTGPLAAAVPEPTSLALLGLGGLLIARRRRA